MLKQIQAYITKQTPSSIFLVYFFSFVFNVFYFLFFMLPDFIFFIVFMCDCCCVEIVEIDKLYLSHGLQGVNIYICVIN